jgi:protein farnesyltransferase/geranylgeranyltransferase type-1 subunit alpha
MSNEESKFSLYDGKEYIPIEDHSDKWADVTPIEQYNKETDPGICKIDYTPAFEYAMTYFRAILETNEISRRALELTQVVIGVNYGWYTAWYIRRKCLDEIGTVDDWAFELKFLDSIGVKLQKNYQIWHHRRWIVQKLNDPSHEKAFLEDVFVEEDKNYHAWSHRIWVVKHFNLFDGEIELIDEMIKDNPMNNSAWSYRYFLINHTKELTEKVVEEEINYAFNIINEYKLDNEAPWVYLRGFLARSQEEADRSQLSTSSAKRTLITDFPFIKITCEKMLHDHLEGEHGYRFINILLLDYIIAENDNSERAIDICWNLAYKYDPIRENYWNFRKQKIEAS